MSKTRDKKGIKKSELQKDDIIQAVVVMDSFNENFMPANSCLASLPVVNKKLIDYTLEWLNSAGVNEVILFCSTHINAIRKYAEEKQVLHIKIKVLVSEDCRTLGDVMRALDRYAVISKNFILLSVDVIGNVNFLPVFDKFKNLQDKDKETTMMLLCKDVGNQRTDIHGKIVLAANAENRILYQSQNFKSVKLPMKVLLQNDYVDIRDNLLYTGVAICSMAVPPLFTDNFDFQTLDDLIKELLTNDEIVQGSVYYHCLEQNHYLARISNWPMYQIVSQDIIRRWTYPMVLDITDKYNYHKNSIYLKNVTFSKDCKLLSDVVIGNETNLKNTVYIDSSVIGDKCVIGDNVRIENSYIFSSTLVEENCVISYSIIGDRCHIKKNTVVENNCILGPDVTIEANAKLSNLKLISSNFAASQESSDFSVNSALYKNSVSENPDLEDEEVPGLVVGRCVQDEWEHSESSSESSDRSSAASPALLDDVKIFYNEVLDSLTRGFEDKLKCENLILEINSSRYAYNVTVNEVNYNLICAILNINSEKTDEMHPKDALQYVVSKLNYFMPLIKNYIKNNSAQQDCLVAVEELAAENKSLLTITPKILQLLYYKDVLIEDEILSWYNQIAKGECRDLTDILKPFIQWLNEADEESEDSSD